MGEPAIDVPFSVNYVHRLRFTSDALNPANPVLADVLQAGGDGRATPLAVFVDSELAEAWPALPVDLKEYVSAHRDVMELAAPVQYVLGGEQCKNDQNALLTMLRRIDEARLCRQSFVVALGGGAVLDVVGFAAAIAHRGVRLVRLPTTTLAQGDSGVGVKNGINGFGKKNYLGAFAPPWAVINDEKFLTTLSERDWRCGFSEAVKVACIKDAAFFAAIESGAGAIRRRDHRVAVPVIARSAELHLRHIVEGGDPFEMTAARPLDFGHWAAHKLEQMTGFRLRHGEAVAIGIAVDVMYAQLAGLLDEGSAGRILRCLGDLGFALYDQALEHTDVLCRGLAEFREHLGGQLTITLVKGIGRPVDVHEMDASLIRAAIGELSGRARHRTPR